MLYLCMLQVRDENFRPLPGKFAGGFFDHDLTHDVRIIDIRRSSVFRFVCPGVMVGDIGPKLGAKT